MRMNKKGMDMGKVITSVVLGIVLIIVVFQLVAGTAADLQGAGNNISATTLPLASLFSGTGVVLLIFMAFLLVAIIGILTGWAKFGKGR